MKQSIGHIALVVREYDEAIDFYVNTFGFRLVEDRFVPEQNELGLNVLPRQNKRWVLVAPPSDEVQGSATSLLLARAATPEQARFIGNQSGGRVFLFLHTDDFWRDFELYKARGVEFVRAPITESYGTVAVFKDLYGNLWDLLGLSVQVQKAMTA